MGNFTHTTNSVYNKVYLPSKTQTNSRHFTIFNALPREVIIKHPQLRKTREQKIPAISSKIRYMAISGHEDISEFRRNSDVSTNRVNKFTAKTTDHLTKVLPRLSSPTLLQRIFPDIASA